MLPDDGEELLQKLSSEMGLPDFMQDVAMADMDDPYTLPHTMREEDVSDSTASSETELGPIANGCNTSDHFTMNHDSSGNHSFDVEAVAADLLSSGVLDQIMAEELTNTPDFTEQDTKPIIVNTFDQNLLNSLHQQGLLSPDSLNGNGMVKSEPLSPTSSMLESNVHSPPYIQQFSLNPNYFIANQDMQHNNILNNLFP